MSLLGREVCYWRSRVVLDGGFYGVFGEEERRSDL
jgi:hypothetical protein